MNRLDAIRQSCTPDAYEGKDLISDKAFLLQHIDILTAERDALKARVEVKTMAPPLWEGEGSPCWECANLRTAYDGYSFDVWCEEPDAPLVHCNPEYTDPPYWDCPYRKAEEPRK